MNDESRSGKSPEEKELEKKLQELIAWRIFRSLNDINIEMISQGASQISVTFLVQEDKMEEAVRRLHHEFFVGPDPKLFEPVGQLDP